MDVINKIGTKIEILEKRKYHAEQTKIKKCQPMFGSFLVPSSTVDSDESQERTKILLAKTSHLLLDQMFLCFYLSASTLTNAYVPNFKIRFKIKTDGLIKMEF
jgi:hypothetical protein